MLYGELDEMMETVNALRAQVRYLARAIAFMLLAAVLAAGAVGYKIYEHELAINELRATQATMLRTEDSIIGSLEAQNSSMRSLIDTTDRVLNILKSH